MFTFPKASSKTTWNGQGELWDDRGMLPYLGGDSLGLCYGMSALWIKGGAPPDVKTLVSNKKSEILEVQTGLRQNAGAGEKSMIDFTADDAGLVVTDNSVYGEPASVAILDLLGSTATYHYLLSFYYTTRLGVAQGHAVGISFDSPSTGQIFDPNYGVGTYTSRSLLCDDLHKMLATYVAEGGHVTKIYLQAVDNVDAFGEFQ